MDTNLEYLEFLFCFEKYIRISKKIVLNSTLPLSCGELIILLAIKEKIKSNSDLATVACIDKSYVWRITESLVKYKLVSVNWKNQYKITQKGNRTIGELEDFNNNFIRDELLLSRSDDIFTLPIPLNSILKKMVKDSCYSEKQLLCFYTKIVPTPFLIYKNLKLMKNVILKDLPNGFSINEINILYLARTPIRNIKIREMLFLDKAYVCRLTKRLVKLSLLERKEDSTVTFTITSFGEEILKSYFLELNELFYDFKQEAQMMNTLLKKLFFHLEGYCKKSLRV